MPLRTANKFGGRCKHCHAWTDPGHGFLAGKHPVTGRWKVECKACLGDAGPVDDIDDDDDDEWDDWYDPSTERFKRARQPTHPRTPPCVAHLGLTLPTTVDEINRTFRRLSLQAHPDHGGEARTFIAIKNARDEAIRYVGGR